MRNPLLLDLVLYLQGLELIEEDGVDAFRDYAPADPDDAVIINEYQGSTVPSYEQTISHRSVQVLARSKDPDKAYKKIWEIFRAFRTQETEEGGGAERIDFTEDRWGQVSLRQSPFRVMGDEAERIYFGFNMGITTQIE